MAVFQLIFLTLVIAVCSQSPPDHPGTVTAKDGEVVIGKVSGGSFGPGSFSAGEPGRNGSAGVGGQADPNHPHVTAGGNIAIDTISGGNHPDGSYSIGHGQDTPSGDAAKPTAAPDSATSAKLSWLCAILVAFTLGMFV